MRVGQKVRGLATDFGSSAGGSSLQINSDWNETPWLVSTDADWVTFLPDDAVSGTGNESLSFQVEANSGGQRSAFLTVNDQAVSITQAGSSIAPPGDLPLLSVERLQGALLLVWEDVAGESSYKIERQEDGGSWQVREAMWPRNSFHFYDGDVAPGSSYRYRVTPVGGAGNGTAGISSEVAFTNAGTLPEVLVLPMRENRVLVAWKSDGTNFLLKRFVNNVGTDLLPVVSGNDPSGYREKTYLDQLPANLGGGGIKLSYQVSANQGTQSTFQTYGLESVTTLNPERPRGVSFPISTVRNALRWRASVPVLGDDPLRVSYRVEGNNGGAYQFLGETSGTSFVDFALDPQAWRYRITPIDESGFAPPAVLAPFELGRKVSSRVQSFERGNPTQNSVSLSWTFSDENLDRRELQQRVGSGDWELVSESFFPGRSGSGSLVDLDAGQTYQLRLRSHWRGVASSWETLPEFKTDLPTPGRPFVRDGTAGQLKVTWPGVPGADYYEVRRSGNGISGWTVITPPGGVAAPRTSFTDTNVTTLEEYFYQVRAGHDEDVSTWSEKSSGIVPESLVVEANYHDSRVFSLYDVGPSATVVLERSEVLPFLGKTDLGPFAYRVRWVREDREVLFPNKVYNYRARITEGRETRYSEVRTIHPVAFPPTNLTTQSRSTGIFLSWIPSASGATYDIERREIDGGNYTLLLADWSQSGFLDQTAVPGVGYEFRILSRAEAPYDGPSRYLGPVGGVRLRSIGDWRYNTFGTTQNLGEAANSADPDGDGIPNLGELLFGNDPNVPDTLDSQFVMEDGVPGSIRYALREDFAAWPVQVTLQVSSNLASWPIAVMPGRPIDGTVSGFSFPLLDAGDSIFYRFLFDEIDIE